MQSGRLLALVAGVAASVGWSGREAEGASFTPLGVGAIPFGVSDDGSTAVGRLSSSREAFRWTAFDGVTPLGDFEGGEFNSLATDASADGRIIVGQATSALGQEAFIWSASGGMASLGDLAGGIVASQANVVSADGSIVGGRGTTASGTEGFLWTQGGGLESIGDLPGGQVMSSVVGMSPDGSTVVGTSSSSRGREIFRWTAQSGMVGLGGLPGFAQFVSQAGDVSADGAVVVGDSTSPTGRRAVRWTEAGMVSLGDLPGGLNGSLATSVSGDGSIVVGFGNAGEDAFIWTQAWGMRYLLDVLETDLGLDLTGWRLSAAYGISLDGRTIVGSGYNPDGDQEGWIAVLPAILPEVGPGLLLLLSCLGLTASRWKLASSAT